MVEIEEVPKESASWEAESPSEVVKKHDTLTRLGQRKRLLAGNAPLNSGWYLPGADEGFNGGFGNLRTLPTAAGSFGKISAGSLHCWRWISGRTERCRGSLARWRRRGSAAVTHTERGPGTRTEAGVRGRPLERAGGRRRSSNGGKEARARGGRKVWGRRIPKPSPSLAYKGGGGRGVGSPCGSGISVARCGLRP